MRAFVAVLLTDEVRARLSASPHRTPPAGVRVKWVAEPNLHLTLDFLGDIDASRISALTRALSAASGSSRAFELSVRGLGQFPERGAPRVLWAGADGGAELIALQRAAHRALGAEGFALEERAFAPHVTLGRIHGFSRPGWWPQDPSIEFGKVEVTSFVAMESRLSAPGPAYRVVERFPLSAG